MNHYTGGTTTTCFLSKNNYECMLLQVILKSGLLTDTQIKESKTCNPDQQIHLLEAISKIPC